MTLECLDPPAKHLTQPPRRIDWWETVGAGIPVTSKAWLGPPVTVRSDRTLLATKNRPSIRNRARRDQSSGNLTRRTISMNCTPRIFRPRVAMASVLLLVIAVAQTAQAVPYVPGNNWSYIDLAAPPQQLGAGSDYPGMWEYVYDVWGGSASWTRFANISGFDADAIVNQHTATTGEDVDGDGDIQDYGVWQRWDSHSVGGFAPWGGFRENSIYPSYWNSGTASWDLASNVGGGNWPGQNHQFEVDNQWHSGDDYKVTHTEICPSFCFFDDYNNFRRFPGIVRDYDASPGGDTLEFDSFVHTSVGWGWENSSLELTFRVVHPNAPGSIQWSTFHNDNDWVEGTITGPGLVGACLIGDADCDGYVDVGGDILPAFTNFTGPGSFGKTRAQGDVHGPSIATTDQDPHDGDVDVSDLLTMFGAFTGPAPDGSGGLVAAEAGDPNIPDLIYNAATGEVTLDVDGSGIIGYVLKNGDNSFAFGSHLQILAGVKTSVAGELSEAAFASAVGANSIGNVFPTGMNLAALTAYLTVNDVSTSLGAPVVPFDLVVLSTGPAVPEPATVLLSVFGLLGMAMVASRRRRAA